ncbi:mechanosensitive ion channel protein [Xaviernesmea oryzae]|uniref:Small-conductance mechanosensitive channel n=1 Tax=Xaviernesmea oryzae TaxID=464029 RepID=A0A1Q9AT20_9HYPH|nr:mechanosensitive ion channel family protein [Xaviernesmea oryzae]OLP58582.1 mechanosensitive ion channel protein [Xaviernesmea oryzae]SEK63082.1 small conductance mechanosensitive channel [Xaviernesmea oryzae]
MDNQVSGVLVATRTAFTQITALAIQYSFSIIGAIILLVIGWTLARLIHNWAYSGLKKVHGIDETLARFFANIIRYALLLLVFITVLGQFGVQTASIIAALGAAGLAIGLALQGTLQNIAAGIMLLVLRPFRVGETIQTPQVSGTVREIGLFATELVNADGVYLLAPNSTLWNVPVTNFSREATRKFDLSVTVSRADIDRALKVLDGLAEENQDVLENPEPRVFVDSFSGDNATLILRAWIATHDWWKTSRELTQAAQLRLAQSEIPVK